MSVFYLYKSRQRKNPSPNQTICKKYETRDMFWTNTIDIWLQLYNIHLFYWYSKLLVRRWIYLCRFLKWKNMSLECFQTILRYVISLFKLVKVPIGGYCKQDEQCHGSEKSGVANSRDVCVELYMFYLILNVMKVS